ncbi:DUF58 domain-containing protein [Haloarcula sp. S1CR25-12]|uniref:DUF58 domain-containing protein n=1 Tax=Haloarcula saliterrae TaxID=2950534 RepID=A0ABU2FDC5_9EURY|nr:DUF58 domain-containing protein [Haloarcula sp. S1CR25-12]MDS0259938.1 DUF58 domain-containing protein [Haloarcula sp. S1CR25-12]
MRRRVHRWSGGMAGTLLLVCVGLLWGNAALLAAVVVPLTYVVYGSLSRVPADAALELTRTVTDGEPTPGEPVRVELTVENTGPAALTDVRVIDGVPAELAVVDGSPRDCMSLRSGEAATLTYSVMAKRGSHDFDTAAVRVRTLSASDEVTVELSADGDGTLTCANTVSEAPLTDATLPRVGTLPTDSGGDGLEFHSTRSYQRGDPVNRLDWRRYAKTSELTTIDYREEQAVRTVLLVDARPAARLTPAAGYPTGAELSAYAAERLFDALSAANAVVSVAAVGLDDADVPGGLGPDGLAWVDDADEHTAARVARLFDGVGAAAARDATTVGGEAGDASETVPPSVPTTDGGCDDARAIRARLPPTAQVVVFSPLTDDWPVALAESLTLRDYLTTLVAPDVARRDTVGTSVFALDRAARLRRAELTGTSVVDWDLDSPIDVALRASFVDLFSG